MKLDLLLPLSDQEKEIYIGAQVSIMSGPREHLYLFGIDVYLDLIMVLSLGFISSFWPLHRRK